MRTYEGKLLAEGLRIAVVASRFNEFITGKLVAGALDALRRHGAREEDLSLAWVPGAFEIPLAAKMLAARTDIDAVVCVGAVIRGSTPHFDYVCAEVSKGIASIGMSAAKPVAFGVLTTDNLEQAIERAGSKAGNKGWEAAMSAIEMARLLPQL